MTGFLPQETHPFECGIYKFFLRHQWQIPAAAAEVPEKIIQVFQVSDIWRIVFNSTQREPPLQASRLRLYTPPW